MCPGLVVCCGHDGDALRPAVVVVAGGAFAFSVCSQAWLWVAWRYRWHLLGGRLSRDGVVGAVLLMSWLCTWLVRCDRDGDALWPVVFVIVGFACASVNLLSGLTFGGLAVSLTPYGRGAFS